MLAPTSARGYKLAPACFWGWSMPLNRGYMEPFEISQQPPEPDSQRPWWRLLNRYHWFVLVVAALGWLFDTMDQQLFNIARRPAMQKLLEPAPGVSPDN